MRLPALSVGMAVLMLAPIAVNASDQASPDGRIRAIGTAIDKAISQGDADGYVADAAEDAIFMPPNEPALPGKGRIRDWARDAFANLKLELEHIPAEITVTGGFAHVHGRVVGTVTPKAGGAPVSYENKYVWILRKGTGDRWQILRAIWNTNKPG